MLSLLLYVLPCVGPFLFIEDKLLLLSVEDKAQYVSLNATPALKSVDSGRLGLLQPIEGIEESLETLTLDQNNQSCSFCDAYLLCVTWGYESGLETSLRLA